MPNVFDQRLDRSDAIIPPLPVSRTTTWLIGSDPSAAHRLVLAFSIGLRHWFTDSLKLADPGG